MNAEEFKAYIEQKSLETVDINKNKRLEKKEKDVE